MESNNIQVHLGNVETKALVNSGIQESLTNAGYEQQKQLLGKIFNNTRFETFSKDIIKMICVIVTSVKCSDWTAEDVKFTVVEVVNQPRFGRDLCSHLGISPNQSKLVQSK